MTSFAIAAGRDLLIARPGASWTLEVQLEGKSPDALAVDPADPAALYAGTMGHGLWRSQDGGSSWEPVAEGIPHAVVTSVAVAGSSGGHAGPLYAGTEPSTLSRSDDRGESWRPLSALLELPSSSRWSFPPKPETHHVRWIQIDPIQPAQMYVAIEAGALVRSLDGGESWQDRVQGGPIDTHTASMHRQAAGRLYSAAGDGYFETADGGDTWSRPMAGLQHGYMVSVAVDPADPETVLVSGSSGPYAAYYPANAEAYVYRKAAGDAFELAMEGLPAADGTVASRLATHADEPGVFYAANNHGLFRAVDAGRSWRALEIDWPAGAFERGVAALVVFAD